MRLPYILTSSGDGEDPYRSYRPPTRPPGWPEDDLRLRPAGGRSGQPAAPWATRRDIISAIVIGFSAFVYVAFIGGLADVVWEGEEGMLIASYIVVAVLLVAVALTVAAFARLNVAMLAGILVITTAIVVVMRVLADAQGPHDELFGLPVQFIDGALSSSMFMATAWLFWRLKYHAPARSVGFVAPARPTAYLWALGAWLLALVAIAIWGTIVERFGILEPPDNAEQALEIAGGGIGPALLLVGLLAPFAEEVFFRGFLLTALLGRMKPLAALLLSSLIFALFHLAPGLYIPTFVLGLALGWVYLKTHSIWPSIFLHAVHNSLVITATWQGLNAPDA